MLQVCIIAIWSQGLILTSGRSYATFGTKIPVFRANSGCLLGTNMQKWWIYKNVSRIVKIVHSADVTAVYAFAIKYREKRAEPIWNWSQQSVFTRRSYFAVFEKCKKLCNIKTFPGGRAFKIRHTWKIDDFRAIGKITSYLIK